MPDIFDVDAADPEELRPQPFSDGAKPGWYAIAPGGEVADMRRFDRYVDIQKAIDAGRMGLPYDKGLLTARFLSPEGWMTDWENQQRKKIEHRLSTGEFMIKDSQVVCSFCHGNCGQCGNTGLTDVNGVSMDAMVYNLQNEANPVDALKDALVEAVVKDPWMTVLRLLGSMGVVLFLIIWYDVLVHYLRHIGVIN